MIKSQYNPRQDKCPVCEFETTQYEGGKKKNLAQHITRIAKGEALRHIVIGSKAPHAEYIKKHHKQVKVTEVPALGFEVTL